MHAKELIDAMTAKALWISPGGKTPWATLYSALIREIALKGKESRFVKTGGKFAGKQCKGYATRSHWAERKRFNVSLRSVVVRPTDIDEP